MTIAQNDTTKFFIDVVAGLEFREEHMRTVLRVLGALGLLLLPSMIHCGGQTRTTPGLKQPLQAARKIIRIAAQSPESLDPIRSKNYWESEIVLQIFDGLLQFDQDLNVIPALAQDWQISPDGKIYTFHLRQGVRFHNGREVKAEDFVYSMTRLLDPKLDSVDVGHYLRIRGAEDFRAGRTSVVTGLKALDPATIQISLERAYAPFLKILAQQPASVVPREAVERGEDEFSRHPVGTGAFRLKSWDNGGTISLSANTGYFEGCPKLDEIQIHTVSALNAKNNFQDFADGKVDLAFVPSDQLLEARRNANWVCLSRPVLRFMYLGLNCKDRLMKDHLVRQAVYLAINRTEVIGHEPDYSVLNRLIPQSLLGSNPREDSDSYDLLAARQAFRKAQLKMRLPLRFSLWHAVLSQERMMLLNRLRGSLESAGVKVDLRLVPSLNELLQKIYAGQTQMFLLGEVFDFPDPDALLSRLFHSRSKGNPFGYSNADVDGMIEEAQTVSDDDARAALYRKIEQRILEDHVVVPLVQVKYSLVHRRALQGIELSPLGLQYLPFKSIWLEGM